MGWSAFGKGLAAGIIGEAGRQVESNELRVNKLIDDQTKAYGKRVEEAKLTRKEENKRNRIILQGFKIRFSDTPNGLRRGAWYLKEFGPEAAEAFLEKADLALKQGTPYTDFLKWAPAGTDTTVRSLDDYTNSLSTPWDLPAFGQTQAALSGREQMPWWGKGQYDASLLAATPSIDDFKRDESIIIDAEEGSGPQFSLLQSDADTRELNRTAKERLHNIIAKGPGEPGSTQAKEYAAAKAALTAINEAKQTPSPDVKGFTSSDRNALAVIENSLKRNWSETVVGVLKDEVEIRANGITTIYNITTQAKELAAARKQFVIGYNNAMLAIIDKNPDLFSAAGLPALRTLYSGMTEVKPDPLPKVPAVATPKVTAAPDPNDKKNLERKIRALDKLIAEAGRTNQNEVTLPDKSTAPLSEVKESRDRMVKELDTIQRNKTAQKDEAEANAKAEKEARSFPDARERIEKWLAEGTRWSDIESTLKARNIPSEDIEEARKLIAALRRKRSIMSGPDGGKIELWKKLFKIMGGGLQVDEDPPVTPGAEQPVTPDAEPPKSAGDPNLTKPMVEGGYAAYEAGDYAEAAKWFHKAAEQGDAEAQYALGVMYGNGNGVTQDSAEAVKWHRKAAEQGNAFAQGNLGLAYYNGWGVTQDLDEAAKWTRKAAEQGDADAQNKLAVMYYAGYGVTKDNAEAGRWFRKAAEQGNLQAKKWLELGGDALKEPELTR